MMRDKLCILTTVLLLGAAPVFAEIYSVEAFETSLPRLYNDIVLDRADTVSQLGKHQAWYCFDITQIPDSQRITGATFTVRMHDYAVDAATERTLWYDPYDDWAFSWPHDPDSETARVPTELLAVFKFYSDEWTWITTEIDINQHDWSEDLVDNYVTLMLTGPLNGAYSAGEAGFDGAVLELETELAVSSAGNTTDVLNLGPEEIIRADGQDIEVPGYSVPSLADWNNDNLKDLIVGEGGGFEDGRIRVYLNVGTESEPAFSQYFYVQSDEDDLTCPESGCMGCFPRVVYWDADMRKDLLIGQADGTIKIFLNKGTDEEPSFEAGRFITAGPDNENLDVGARATPTLTDWNNDGMIDLVVGSYDGKIRVYLNDGLSGGIPPGFGLSMPSGNVVLQNGEDLVVPSRRSSPEVLDLDGDGKKDLLTGNTEGQLLFYRNIGSDDNPEFSDYSFIESDGAAIDLYNMPRSRPYICYWTGDGNFGPIDNHPDVLIGSGDGKVRLYRGMWESTPLTGDLDGSGLIDIADLTLLIAQWPRSDCGLCEGADLTGDGNVTREDLHVFLDILLSTLEEQL
jgi:WD40 repeat protein